MGRVCLALEQGMGVGEGVVLALVALEPVAGGLGELGWHPSWPGT